MPKEFLYSIEQNIRGESFELEVWLSGNTYILKEDGKVEFVGAKEGVLERYPELKFLFSTPKQPNKTYWDMVQQRESFNESREDFSEYGHYGENNPPLPFTPVGDKDYDV